MRTQVICFWNLNALNLIDGFIFSYSFLMIFKPFPWNIWTDVLNISPGFVHNVWFLKLHFRDSVDTNGYKCLWLLCSRALYSDHPNRFLSASRITKKYRRFSAFWIFFLYRCVRKLYSFGYRFIFKISLFPRVRKNSLMLLSTPDYYYR